MLRAPGSRGRFSVLAAAAAMVPACASILSLDDIRYGAADAGHTTADGGWAADAPKACSAPRPGVGDGGAAPALERCEEGGLPVDLRTSANCGACRHSCFGDDCVDGTCAGRTIHQVPNSTYVALQVVNGSLHFLRQNGTTTLDVDVLTDAGVVVLGTFPLSQPWVGYLYTAAIRPPLVSALLSTSMMAGDLRDPDAGLTTIAPPFDPYNVEGVAADETRFYFVERTGRIYSRDLSTGSEQTIAQGQSARFTILAADDAVWWLNEGDIGSIARYSPRTGAVQVVAEGLPRPEGLALDAEFLYFGSLRSGSVELRRVPRTGGPSEVLGTFQGARRSSGIFPRNESLLWLLSDDADAASRTDFVGYAVPFCGGAPRPTQRFNSVTELAMAGEYAYWSNLAAVHRVVP